MKQVQDQVEVQILIQGINNWQMIHILNLNFPNLNLSLNLKPNLTFSRISGYYGAL